MTVLTAAMRRAVRDRRYPLALLAAIDHPDGVFYAWTGIGTLSWDGHEWTGVGVLGSITPVRQVTDLQIQELQFHLSGVPPQQTKWLSSSVRGREAQAWLAALKPDGTVVKYPYRLSISLLDYQSYFIDESGSPQLTLIGQTGFYTLDRAVDEVWSAEDQKRSFPTDTGLDLMYTLVNQTVNWTRV